MEETQFKSVDVVFQACSQIGVKAVHQVLLQEIDCLLLWLAVLSGQLGDHRVNFGPHLRFSVHVNQRIEYLMAHDNLLVLNLVVELLCHLNKGLFHFLIIEVFQGATKLLTCLLGDWEFLRVEDFSVSGLILGQLLLDSVDLEACQVILNSHVKFLSHLF